MKDSTKIGDQIDRFRNICQHYVNFPIVFATHGNLVKQRLKLENLQFYVICKPLKSVNAKV
ncbi:MAG: hypothetical protein COB78_09085 [Hyphomicrobiales bacterium]|nr:MAG: hypothetical protein COB78_09085 [Hyphomicrobiales bacterium]